MYVCMYVCMYICTYILVYITVHKPSMLKSAMNLQSEARYGKPGIQMLLKTRSLILQTKTNSLHLYTQTYGHLYNIKQDRMIGYLGIVVG